MEHGCLLDPRRGSTNDDLARSYWRSPCGRSTPMSSTDMPLPRISVLLAPDNPAPISTESEIVQFIGHLGDQEVRQ